MAMTTRPRGTDEMITRREASELAKVHINTVRLWEKTERVRTVKGEGGIVLLYRAEVEAIAEARHDSALDKDARIAQLEERVTMLERMLADKDEGHRAELDRILSVLRTN